VDRVGADLLGRVDHLLDRQVALQRRGGTDLDRLVGLVHVAQLPVRLGVDGNAWNAEIAARPDHALRDLGAVGNQNLLEHRALLACDRSHGQTEGR
jgi:hypothetical protein